MGFAQRLKELRELHHMTQQDLSRKLKITRQAVGNYEQGTRFPQDERILCDIANLFNVSLDDLLGRAYIPGTTSSPHTALPVYFHEKSTSYHCPDKDSAISRLLLEIHDLPLDVLEKLTETIYLLKNFQHNKSKK
ncbi:MAG: helix-turn-helix transcriptional regulator [Thermotaleaceae bacterium]